MLASFARDQLTLRVPLSYSYSAFQSTLLPQPSWNSYFEQRENMKYHNVLERRVLFDRRTIAVGSSVEKSNFRLRLLGPCCPERFDAARDGLVSYKFSVKKKKVRGLSNEAWFTLVGWVILYRNVLNVDDAIRDIVILFLSSPIFSKHRCHSVRGKLPFWQSDWNGANAINLMERVWIFDSIEIDKIFWDFTARSRRS